MPAERIDSAEFVDLAERGAAALAAGTVEAGRTLLARALSLWRGDAYQEFDDVAALAAQKDRLAAYRLTAIEQRVDADLLLGRARELIYHQSPSPDGKDGFSLWNQGVLVDIPVSAQYGSLSGDGRVVALRRENLPGVWLQRLS